MSRIREQQKFRSLFVNSINYGSTEASLISHFRQWGEIVHCSVKRDPNTGQSRGFGFVTYKRAYMVDDAQAARPHIIDGRVVNTKRAFPRSESYKEGILATVNIIYINGITEDFREDDLREYFSRYGNIVSVNIVTNKKTGKNRGFAFVEFDDYDPVDKIMLSPHKCKGRELDVRKSTSRNGKSNSKMKKETEGLSRGQRTLHPAEPVHIDGYSGGCGYGGGYWQDCYGNSYLICPGGFGNFGYGNIYPYEQGGGAWGGNFPYCYDRMPVQDHIHYAEQNQEYYDSGQVSGEYSRP